LTALYQHTIAPNQSVRTDGEGASLQSTSALLADQFEHGLTALLDGLGM
jgi:hypothetical protein